MKEDLLSRISKYTSFNHKMDKLEISQSRTLKRQKRMKIGLKNNEHIVAADWVDEEVQYYLSKRRKLNKIWRTARRKEKLETIINQAELEYRE